MVSKKVLSLITLLATTAYANNSVYVDVNAGVNTTYTGLGLNVNAGYLFNPYFAVEGGFTFAPSSPNWNSGNNYYMVDAAAKGILPLGNVFSLYGKLGIAYNTYASCCGGAYYNNGSSFVPLIGVGGQFKLSNDWSLHVEDYASINNPNMLMFGAEYKY